MRKRSLAREVCLKVLYQMDVTLEDYQACLENYWLREEEASSLADESIKDFVRELVKGVAEHLKEIDAKISQHATNWEIERMAVIDRNILRLACFELLFRQDIPPKVSINEAIELAKKYSEPQSGRFVNGILDKIKSDKKA
jgi:transcription antitermination factor NusB